MNTTKRDWLIITLLRSSGTLQFPRIVPVKLPIGEVASGLPIPVSITKDVGEVRMEATEVLQLVTFEKSVGE